MKFSTNTTAFLPAVAAAFIIAGSLLYAGPLNPPAGPVTSTNKTLTEVEPRTAINLANTPGDADSLFRITQPGSYYLTGNITGVVGKHGIEIASSGVSLDLYGFEVRGVPGSLNGITLSVTVLRDISVVNGTVSNWGSRGVDLSLFESANCLVEDIRASGNGSDGIRVSSDVLGLEGSSVITRCVAYQNGGIGISIGSGGVVSNCSSMLNSGSGFTAGSGVTITQCSAYRNGGSGIAVASGTTVVSCTTFSNTLDGIRCANRCVIRENTCTANGNGTGDGAGIHATGVDNRIEGNNCLTNDRGIDVDAAGNIIIRNTCSGNTTNWDIVANNIFGAIIDRTAPGSLAVIGNAATSTLGTSDANANFSY